MIKLIPTIDLVRLEENDPYGTFGALRICGQVFCWTLEPMDKENAQSISSIPAQQYTCRRTVRPRTGETFEVTNVPDRRHILFHPGNTAGDTQGCILLASALGDLRGQRAVLSSGRGFRIFMATMVDVDKFLLTVKEHY